MLDFYLGTNGFHSKSSDYLGGMSADNIDWLRKNEFLKKGFTGHVPDDDPESLPYFDDVVLRDSQVQSIYEKLTTRLEIVSQTQGFKSEAVDRLSKILVTAIENNMGLSTIAD